MTILVNLYGGPGAGKSTCAANVFSEAKTKGYNAELVLEFVKQWAWEGKKPVNYDQFYFFGQQSRREYQLFNKVDLIITDSPVALCGYFASVFGKPSQALCFRQMVMEYYSMVKNSNVDIFHFFLERSHGYDQRGRFQTKEEAEKMDVDQLLYLKSFGFDVKKIKADNSASNSILREVVNLWEMNK